MPILGTRDGGCKCLPSHIASISLESGGRTLRNERRMGECKCPKHSLPSLVLNDGVVVVNSNHPRGSKHEMEVA
jgi:hypothetical protein